LSYSLTVTNVVEHAFCPRFTYFELVLGIAQREEKRGTVQSGCAFHSLHSKTNRSYVTKRLSGVKRTELLLYSKVHFFSGKIDEAIEADDQVMIIERKYSDYIVIGATLKTQLGLLAVLAEENTGKKVKQAIVVFDKKTRVEVPVRVSEKLKETALLMLQNTRQTLISGSLPNSRHDNRCLNCCYRKICP
jgi:CRISPR-associated exonuclease Cas4